MKWTVEVDAELLDQSRAAVGIDSPEELVEFALRELLRRKFQRKLLNLRGKVKWEGDLDEFRRSRFPD